MTAPRLPTESEILSSFLLSPAQLSTIITLPQFKSLFPVNQRQKPEVHQLYDDLTFLRTIDVELIANNIQEECATGARHRLAMWRELRKRGADVNGELPELDSMDVRLDEALLGRAGSVPEGKGKMGTEALLDGMERACRYLDASAKRDAREAQSVMGKLEEVVGGLSDLRYGRFGKGLQGETVEDEVRKEIKDLERAIAEPDDGWRSP